MAGAGNILDPMNVKSGLEVASLTDVGCQRENNEDSFLYWEPTAEGELQRKGRLAVIADGMGGYEGGQEASRLAVETVREVYDNVVGDDPHVALLEAFAKAHERIQSYAGHHPVLHGMGTTCTALVILTASFILLTSEIAAFIWYAGRASRASLATILCWPTGRDWHCSRRRCRKASATAHSHSRIGRRHRGSCAKSRTGNAPAGLRLSSLCTDGLWGV